MTNRFQDAKDVFAGMPGPIPTCDGAGLRFGVHPPGEAQRPAVEALIRRVYAERYGARVGTLAPVLVSLQDPEVEPGEPPRVVAAAGYRFAGQPLFLERYLDAPVEQLLARAGAPVPRERIVEVAHLAAERNGEGRRLILCMAQHFAKLPVDWVVSTLTAELRALFARMGIAPLALGLADPARLDGQVAEWGSYYDHHPVVLAGHLPLALRRIAQLRSRVPRA